MQLPCASYKHSRHRQGFTLLEVLTVMVIIVILATMIISIYSWLETKKNEETAQVIVQNIERGLADYHQDHDRYPYGSEKPFKNGGVAVADGEEYSSNVLYMALFGDYNNDGIPDKKARIYLEDLNPATQSKNNPLVRKVNITDKSGLQSSIYILVDPWGMPYRYRLGSDQPLPTRSEQASAHKHGNGWNPDFDVWSFGKDSDSNLTDPDAKENDDDIGNLPKL